MIGIFTLVTINTIVLVLFKNTMYTIPTILSFLFVISKAGLPLDDISLLKFPLFAFAVFLIGPIAHFIRFKPKFVQGKFLLGFGLIGLAYLIPLIYLPFEFQGLLVSVAGITFVGFYIFFVSTIKGNLNYLFKILIFVNLLLTLEVFFYMYQGYLIHPELDLYHRILVGWTGSFGWGNLNYPPIYIALTMPSYLYFIFKKPNSYLLWLLMILPITAVFITQSRGGMLDVLVSLLGMFLFLIIKGNKKHLTHGFIFLFAMLIIFYLGRDIAFLWWEEFLRSLGNNIDSLTTGRLYIYEQGWLIFKQYPIFGGGWLSIKSFPFENPTVFMFHSTIIQTIATMGLFGVAALLTHYYQIGTFMFKKINLEKSLFIIGYVATQVHGLIDNVQYAIPYSVMLVLLLSIYETAEKESSFEMINHRYHLIEDK